MSTSFIPLPDVAVRGSQIRYFILPESCSQSAGQLSMSSDVSDSLTGLFVFDKRFALCLQPVKAL